jgi:dTDP-4-dehydrorhamnose 3,5-epimerase
MRFTETPVQGAHLIEPELRGDERGFFARMWESAEFAARGLNATFVQCNNSYSVRRGTLRGLHYQAPPHGEAKLVRCVSGSVFDVLVDVRPGSATLGHWFGACLTAGNRTMVYVPEGCAHGYLTLEDGSEVIYWVTKPYQASAERGIRWNDPRFRIAWPDAGALTLSDKDRAWPDFGADLERGARP